MLGKPCRAFCEPCCFYDVVSLADLKLIALPTIKFLIIHLAAPGQKYHYRISYQDFSFEVTK
jgi:hypothetical protein